jgi:hypothetical protein
MVPGVNHLRQTLTHLPFKVILGTAHKPVPLRSWQLSPTCIPRIMSATQQWSELVPLVTEKPFHEHGHVTAQSSTMVVAQVLIASPHLCGVLNN